MNTNKQTVGKNKVFRFFRRFKRKKIALYTVLYSCIVIFLNTGVGCCYVDQCRYFINSARVCFDQYHNDFKNIFLNLWYFLYSDVNTVLLELRNENIKLRAKIEAIKKLQSENSELKKLLLFKESEKFFMITARVVTVFLNDFMKSCTINVGKIDGVSVNDAVGNAVGLIGRIIEVHDTWSYVLFITDINSNIPVKIGEINAIASGNGSNKLHISTINEDIAIKDGEFVKTSCYGICENIPVGKIVKDNNKFYVDSFVNFNSLKHVFVLRTEYNREK